MGTQQPIRKTVAPEIPDKLYFRIGDVARLCEVPTYVLRFWETEFPQLKPNKGGTGQRLYRRRDVELALRIKSLLYDQGYTIPGARQVFKNESIARSAETAATAELLSTPAALPSSATQSVQPEDRGAAMRQQARLRDLREELAVLLAILSESPAGGDAAVAAVTDTRRGKAELKVQAMRPRLVLEPRSGAPNAAPTGAATVGPAVTGPAGTGTTGFRLEGRQHDLFPETPEDSRDSAEWPEPPFAS